MGIRRAYGVPLKLIWRVFSAGLCIETAAAIAATVAPMAAYQRENLLGLPDLSGKWSDRTNRNRHGSKLILDLDYLVCRTRSHQKGRAFNGRFSRTWYHPRVRMQGRLWLRALERQDSNPGGHHRRQ